MITIIIAWIESPWTPKTILSTAKPILMADILVIFMSDHNTQTLTFRVLISDWGGHSPACLG